MTMHCGLRLTKVAADEQPLSVFVSILPQQHFVRWIGGDRVDIQVMVPPGASPRTYEPRPRMMRAVARAQLYFTVGVPFEKVWLPKISATNPQMKIISTDGGIQKIPMIDVVDVADNHHGHAHDHHNDYNDYDDHNDHNDHNDQSDHSGPESNMDPHSWLAPPLVSIMTGHIQDALVSTDPDQEPIPWPKHGPTICCSWFGNCRK
jgi:zinc transport system substrate-binding protein